MKRVAVYATKRHVLMFTVATNPGDAFSISTAYQVPSFMWFTHGILRSHHDAPQPWYSGPETTEHGFGVARQFPGMVVRSSARAPWTVGFCALPRDQETLRLSSVVRTEAGARQLERAPAGRAVVDLYREERLDEATRAIERPTQRVRVRETGLTRGLR